VGQERLGPSYFFISLVLAKTAADVPYDSTKKKQEKTQERQKERRAIRYKRPNKTK
jgi:hypothetical protein